MNGTRDAENIDVHDDWPQLVVCKTGQPMWSLKKSAGLSTCCARRTAWNLHSLHQPVKILILEAKRIFKNYTCDRICIDQGRWNGSGGVVLAIEELDIQWSWLDSEEKIGDRTIPLRKLMREGLLETD